jgi:hypothetical protein
MGEAIKAIAEYHNDVERSLRLYFSEASPSFGVRFVGLRPDILAELTGRLEETDQRSAFFLLIGLEKAFRVDYECRCRERMRDGGLSKAFRAIHKLRKARARLDEDIFQAWEERKPDLKRLIWELRGAFRFRNYLAHGRLGEPKLGRKYDFNSVYDLAAGVLSAFPLQEPD